MAPPEWSDRPFPVQLQLAPGPAGEVPEAFGRSVPRPPDYEAFGHHRQGVGDARSAGQGRAPSEGAEQSGEQQPRPNGREGKQKSRGRTDQKDEARDRGAPPEENAGEQGERTKDQERPKADAPDKATPPPPAKPPVYKRRGFQITAAAIVLVLIISGIIFWLWYRQYESTDDAYIDGHVTQISPQVAAPIKALHIDDNQLVHKGDLLLELDPTDYQVALDQAQAQELAAHGRLDQARAQVVSSQATVTQAAAEIDAAQVGLDNTTRDLARYQRVDERARSQQQLDNATAAQKNAQAQLEQAKARYAAAQASVVTAQAAAKAAEGDLQQAQANVERARVNLGYCRIIAPSEGRVTERTVENGTYVAPGQAMFALVSPEVWVTANYKETQLTHMTPGQKVTIRVDAFPGKKFAGHVDSIQAGSGARFSVLPAENATGNFVKVVQRVPVKILFDRTADGDDYRLLAPGLSVEPRVKVR